MRKIAAHSVHDGLGGDSTLARHLQDVARGVSVAPRREWQREAGIGGGIDNGWTRPGGTLLIMKTAKKIYESDDHGVVHVDVPVGRSGQRVEVQVLWTDAGESSNSDGDEPGMADLVGLLKGVDLERPPQVEYKKRDPIG